MITKNYIKMCEEADEIQSAWKPKDWDRFIYKDSRELGIACANKKDVKVGSGKIKSYMMKHYIWLPTQEQLQEMIEPILKKKFKDFWDMKRINIWIIQHFINFMHDIDYLDYLDTLNELWLAFVMKEKYNKIWTGKLWKEVK